MLCMASLVATLLTGTILQWLVCSTQPDTLKWKHSTLTFASEGAGSMFRVLTLLDNTIGKGSCPSRF